MRGITSTASVAVDPLQPLLSAMGSLEILKIVDSGNSLCLDGAEEVFLDRVLIVAK